ncbi:MAG: helix-turn-helix domain-containing protein [Solobacterium sp.]|nr:helix-turn-helix domain-containing protein [Solobacterium sp.]
MDRTYSLNDVAMMTGFTTRTLRNYMNQELLKGEKVRGAWQFTEEELDCFFREPFVKEGLRIKRSGLVFDFLSERNRNSERICTVLDIPASLQEGNRLSAFFCDLMNDASDTVFAFDWVNGMCRVILTGAADQVMRILNAYSSLKNEN